MAVAIRSHRGIVETPKKGRPPILEAKFTLTKRTMDTLTSAQIRRLSIKGTKTKIKDIIKKGIRKEYKSSGLKKRSGRLLKAAENFKIDIRVSGNMIFVSIRWEPKLEYFFAHLFGVRIRITPAMRVFVHANDIIHPRASTEFVRIPRRNFLSFKKKVRDGIRDKVFEPAFKPAIDKAADKEKVRRQRRPAGAARRITPFRARREFAEAVQRGQVTQIRTAMARLGPLPVLRIGRR